MDTVFTIMPTNQRISLKPGETYKGTISIVNPADATGDFHYKIYVAPYSVVGEEYNADLAKTTDMTQISKWITVEETKGSVAPNSKKDINYTIKVPKSAAGGGQYAAIMVEQDSEANQEGGLMVNNVFEMASLIYGEVDGDIVHEGEILENSFPSFSLSNDISSKVSVKNTGNTHDIMTVVTDISNALTGETIRSKEQKNNEFSELIMPDSTRTVQNKYDNLPVVGVVKVTQSVYYNGKVSTEQKDIWIVPVWFMVIVAAVLIALGIGIRQLVKRHRKKKSLTDQI